MASQPEEMAAACFSPPPPPSPCATGGRAPIARRRRRERRDGGSATGENGGSVQQIIILANAAHSFFLPHSVLAAEAPTGRLAADKVVYDTGDAWRPCTPFAKNTSEMHSFTPGCLPLRCWNELNAFFQKSGARIVFGLNALNDRVSLQDVSLGGCVWEGHGTAPMQHHSSVTLSSKGYKIHGWELGNELSGISLLPINLGGGNTTKQVSVTHTAKKHVRKIRHGHGFSQGAGA